MRELLERRMTMELSMTIALVAALSIGQAFTALVITAFVLAAELLEHLTVSRGRAAIAALRRLGMRTVLLTGDQRAVAERVGRELAFDDVRAGLLPEQKSAYITALVALPEVVAMIGDGVNDAPALVAATIGVAMGSGTDVARDSADIVTRMLVPSKQSPRGRNGRLGAAQFDLNLS